MKEKIKVFWEKFKLFWKYIIAVVAYPKKAAEAVNEATDVQDLDERIKRI